jgi:hypothetical protein
VSSFSAKAPTKGSPWEVAKPWISDINWPPFLSTLN